MTNSDGQDLIKLQVQQIKDSDFFTLADMDGAVIDTVYQDVLSGRLGEIKQIIQRGDTPILIIDIGVA